MQSGSPPPSPTPPCCARRPPTAVARTAPLSPLEAFARLLAVTLVNPTTVVYFTALVTGARTGPTASAADQAVFVAAAFIASASWQVLLATGGAVLGGVLTSTRGRLVTAVVSAAVIAVLAVGCCSPDESAAHD